MEDSRHSVDRAKERAGLNRKRAIKMMELARHRGITSNGCKWSSDRKYLEGKSTDTTIAVAFNGYCFIMDRLTMNCITMFALPKDFGKKKTGYEPTGRAVERSYKRDWLYEYEMEMIQGA